MATWGPTVLHVLAGTGATTICYVATSDAFPAPVRGFGLGAAATAGKVGAALAPLLIHMLPGVRASTLVLSSLSFGGTLCAAALATLRGVAGAEPLTAADGAAPPRGESEAL